MWWWWKRTTFEWNKLGRTSHHTWYRSRARNWEGYRDLGKRKFDTLGLGRDKSCYPIRNWSRLNRKTR
jgi:hypothetical protein